MFVLLLFLILSLSWAQLQLPEEYQLFIRFNQTKDLSVGYRILRDYPDAVFKEDLMLLMAKEELEKGQEDKAKNLVLNIDPKNLSQQYREDYLNLWKSLNLDPKVGFLKAPILFREFIPYISLSQEEALQASEELFKRRYYKEVIRLLEPFEFSRVCYTLGRAYSLLRERDKAIEVFENCEDQRAKGELAFIYFELGQREKVEKMLSTIKDREVLSNSLFRIGRQSLFRRNYQEAIEYLERMNVSYSREFNLGLSYYALGDYQRALEHFLNSLKYSGNREDRSASYFWAYKSALMVDSEKANEYLIKASNGAGFYHAVASYMLGLPIASKAMRVVMEDESLPRVASTIKSIRSAGFPEYARREAFKRIREISSSDILAISRFDPFLSIRLAVRKYGYGSLVYNAVAFPTPFKSSVERASDRYGIEPALVYAVIRQESLFDPYAVSIANARGLMQLIDSTARYVARKEGIRIKNIYEPNTNILLGTAYLRELLDQWSGDLVRAIASYNAGPSRVRSWNNHQDVYLFIETIPITETRNYVKRVLYDYYVYTEILK
ncbi:MAG: transglycosylase SLT domain-containing protein [Aquificaceae bacterium]